LRLLAVSVSLSLSLSAGAALAIGADILSNTAVPCVAPSRRAAPLRRVALSTLLLAAAPVTN
jgi:hypothetical protein